MGGGQLLDFMGGSGYEGGHRAHGRGVPPLGKTLKCVLTVKFFPFSNDCSVLRSANVILDITFISNYVIANTHAAGLEVNGLEATFHSTIFDIPMHPLCKDQKH